MSDKILIKYKKDIKAYIITNKNNIVLWQININKPIININNSKKSSIKYNIYTSILIHLHIFGLCSINNDNEFTKK